MILEELEVEGHQAGEFFPEGSREVCEAFVNGSTEGLEIFVVAIGQTAFFSQLPQPFDQVQIGAVVYAMPGRQIWQTNLITSLEKEDRSATQLCQTIRGHWSVENKNHWKRDTSLWKEDASRSRKKGVEAKCWPYCEEPYCGSTTWNASRVSMPASTPQRQTLVRPPPIENPATGNQLARQSP